MYDTEKYIEMLDHEIEKLIKKESKMELTTSGESALAVLFENRKHVKRWKEEMHGRTTEASAVTGMAEDSGRMADDPGKSYFGGL